jgi:hypothetical protein
MDQNRGREIPLTQGMFALIDADDYELVSRYCWFAARMGNTSYACHTLRENGKTRILMMHRLILGYDFGDKKITDHINRNGLDNRRKNLRTVEYSINIMNSRIRNTSGYRGVSRDHGKWTVRFSIKGTQIYGGRFMDPIEAAKKYDELAVIRYGDMAVLNFPEGGRNG